MGSLSLRQARERILTSLINAGAIFGTLALMISTPSFFLSRVLSIFPIYAAGIIVLWLVALFRKLPYNLRAGTLLLSIYLFGITELLNFGYTVDGHAYLIACTLFGTLFFNPRVSRLILLANTLTLLVIGWMISTGRFIVWMFLFRNVDLSIVIGTGIIFFSVVGALQMGISVLLSQLDTALQEERELRDQLELRVIERTQELALARDQALASSREMAEQREYLRVLYEITLDLLNHRRLDDLLQTIVKRATTILDAPYGELMIREGDELVVRAYTENQPFLKDDRVGRNEALLSWQACDTCQPAVLDDYMDWAKGRSIYASLSIHAVAEFPIMVGEICQGVLSISRNKIGHTFGPQDIYRGQLFSQLIAVVLENVRLYDIAQREIAERTEAEIALQRTAQELQEQNTELDAFGHTVAHDLKTPLSAMVGYTQLLQASHRRMSPESIDSDLHMILMSGNKMATIINELLLLASIRQSNATDAQVLDMAMIVSEATTRLDYLITKSHAILICPPTWPEALGYAPWVEEVWANYLSNALKYGGTPPRILLGADPPANGFVRFWVRDNGSGIPNEKQDLLFSAFTRLQPARVDGHGLGLSIVSRIVEKLGGSVGVESTLGVGSTFFFMLPVADGVLSTELP